MGHISGKAGSVFLSSYLLEDCEDDWANEANVTSASHDHTDYKVGSASVKIVTATNLSTNALVATEATTGTLDISACNGLTAWVKSSLAMDAGDWQLLTDETASCANPQAHDIPALAASTWTFISINQDMSGGDYNAVVSVGLKQVTDLAALNFWIDDIRAYKAEAGIKSWTVDYTADTLETTDFGSAGVKEYIIAGSSWAGTFEGYKDGAPLAIGQQYGIKLYESATSTQIWTGFVVITGVHPSVGNDGVVSYAYDYQGTGALVPATT